MRDLLRMGAGLGLVGASATAAERLPTAFHEAGHAMVAVHIEEAGVITDNGWAARFAGPRPMLRYATITPRVTAKGQHYLGETKLTVRWRDMAAHLPWAAATASTSPQALMPPTLTTHSCGTLADRLEPAALTSIARITYLFGGHIAEQRLYAAPCGWLGRWFGSGASCESIDARVARLVRKPATATGDVRKAQQVARSVLPTDAGADADSDAADVTPRCFAMAFAFADAIVAWQWPAVCALSGALMARGTMDGAQQHELMQRHRQVLADGQHDGVSGGHGGGGGGSGGGGSGGGGSRAHTLLQLAAPYPFAFGLLWGLLECPACDPILTAPLLAASRRL